MTPIEAWLSTLASYVVAYRRDLSNEYAKALANHIENALLTDSAKIFSSFGAPRPLKPAHIEAIDIIAANKAGNGKGMPTRRYAEVLIEIRNQMKGSREISAKYASFIGGTSVTPAQKSLATVALQLLEPDPAKVEAKDVELERAIAVLPDSVLKAMTVPDVGDQNAHIREIKYLVKRFVKRDDHIMTPEEVKEHEARDPDRVKRYKDLHKSAKEVWERFVRGMIRDNDGRPVKVLEARRALDAAGIKYHPQIDSNGTERLRIGETTAINSAKIGKLCFYTMDGTELNFAPAPDLTLFWNNKWDPKRDDTYVLRMRGPHHKEGFSTRIPSSRFASISKQGVYDDVVDAIPLVPAARTIWLKDLHGGDRGRRTLGAIAETMWHFTPRIGTVGKATFGMSTLTVGHVRASQSGVILDYIGKDSKPQKHVLKRSDPNPEVALCIDVITRQMQGKRKGDYLWTNPKGEHITPAMINDYVRTRCGLPVTPEKFRNIRGTMTMQKLLDKVRIPRGCKVSVLSAKVKELAVTVGTMLGHVRTKPDGTLDITPTTAIKNYISPSIIHEFFTKHGFQTPSWVPREGR